MHLLYADESGNTGDAAQTYFVLAGISLFERQGYWLANQLDNLAREINPADPSSIEFHGSPMFGGKGIWRKHMKADRCRIIREALKIFAYSHQSNRIFACVVDKTKISPNDPVEFSFEQLASRFDHYLSRLHKENNAQRGIIIFDKSTYETTIQGLATDFRTIGHKWGVLRNLSEVPLFLDSKASRLIQLADLIAYSIFRQYEHGDDDFFSIFHDRFDEVGGVKHGLCERL
ncbi:DUF3800 domain-containing protein [Dyadobacter sediminis]|uniref:DUF3800 domain-containing protein n=1 Tax=Dyadobacter sediminis TaxID=1493691 RepID=A0A5R9K6A9_9BACT|nr:DUF3800 domain-containing protein [Dyadobacter sediminis]TLU89312.1 DUF3800 domain-containing protein [Dyadobacter sediminis]GGC06559.1 hypothetical protein GCM10011325_36750 [Dyadobacter sediminis]